MIRGYFSVSKCVKSLHSLKRNERATGVFSNLKNYSVSVKSETESKPKNETEEGEISHPPGDKSILLAAFTKLRSDEVVNDNLVSRAEKSKADISKEPEIVENTKFRPEKGLKSIQAEDLKAKFVADESLINETESVRPAHGTIGGFKKDLHTLKNLISSEGGISDPSMEKLKNVISSLQKKIGQKPPPEDPKTLKAEALQKKFNDYIVNTRQQQISRQKAEYLQNLEQEVKQGRQLSVSHMISALKAMVETHTRPEPLLKLLASKLMNQDELDIKECSDILYALAGLHYRDENVIAKLTENICLLMDSFKSASVINRILRSYAMLSYRDPTILTILIDWICKNKESCKDQIISNTVMSLAVLNYFPAEAEDLVQEFSNNLDLQNSPDTSTFLDYVWSLTLLSRATHEQVNEVLSTSFIEKLKSSAGDHISFSKALKLLNINGYATSILTDYTGSTLKNYLRDVVPSPKYKTTLTTSVIDALFNLMPSSDYIITNVNTRYGFIIDAEFFVDSKGKPLPYVREKNRSGAKIATLVLGYFDLCHGAELVPTGPVALSQRILEARGYKVLIVPYTAFPPNRRLIEKVQFLEEKIKDLAAS